MQGTEENEHNGQYHRFSVGKLCLQFNIHQKGNSGVSRIFENLVAPLAIFLPSEVPVAIGVTGEAQVRVRTRKDWSLTFLAIALIFNTLASGLFQVKYLYAEHIYNWTAEQLSYYVSFMGSTRACCLLFLLPCKSL